MLERSFFSLGVCALLCACGGNYPKKSPTCAADGGCPAMCSAETCADAAQSAGDASSKARAGSGASSRAQAMRVARDGGVKAEGDAATAERDDAASPDSADKRSSAGSSASAMKGAKAGQAGAGGAAAKPAKKGKQIQADAGGEPGAAEPSAGEQSNDENTAAEHAAGTGGEAGAAEPGAGEQSNDESTDAEQAACEQTCGPCQACDDQKHCQPVAGRDDADSCSDTRSCSSRGECLHVSEAQADLGSMQDYAELTQSFAQVLTFTEPATIQEIRLEVSCNENDQTFPAVWLAAAPGGIPTDTIIATTNVLYQRPSDTNTFALLELSKTLEEPATGPIAIVVSKSDMSCNVRLNKENPYPNGNLFTQVATLWTPAEGSMVFQVLSSQ